MSKLIGSSLILGAAAIFSALIISGNVSFKNEHIVPLSGGAVKLGDVYKENKLVSVKLIFKEGEQVLISEGNPETYSEDLDSKIQEIVKLINSGRAKSDEQLTADTLSVTDDSRLELISAVKYSTEHQPFFTLTLEQKEIPMQKGTNIKTFVDNNVKSFINSQEEAYARSLYLTK
ncbi:hypothetical protein LEADMM068B1_03180 [Leclercia adecarboxylata]|uniref:hypothetical protein n=1 Tax=Leclercia adecarboxylata TaxID=83655 RepID=UPI0012BB38F8|nr:hypothetical protein [Leclercia adecarboxylata]QGP84372.1 hypothetical protein GLX29_14130 [Leclercia adecarboxylata]